MRGVRTRWLSVVATLAVLGAGVALMSPQEKEARQRTGGAPAVLGVTTPTPTPSAQRPPSSSASIEARSRVAAKYALAATNWSSATYHSAWRTQLRLAAGGLRRDLLLAEPGDTAAEGLRADGTIRLSALLRIRRTGAHTVLVELDELRLSGGRRERAGSWYRVGLDRQDGPWRVVAFTSVPGDQS